MPNELKVQHVGGLLYNSAVHGHYSNFIRFIVQSSGAFDLRHRYDTNNINIIKFNAELH